MSHSPVDSTKMEQSKPDFNNNESQQRSETLSVPASVPQSVRELLSGDPVIWVFGYGSLLWKTDFPYRSKRIGYIEGFVRRFYQGNETFRGIPGKPGRVANLVEEENGRAWGVAFEVRGNEEVSQTLKRLYAREAVAGGYVTMVTTFHPRQPRLEPDTGSSHTSLSSLAADEDISMESDRPGSSTETTTGQLDIGSDNKLKTFQVLVYTATPDNELYLGPDDVDSMARQVVNSKGYAGTNVEYVTKTADFVRKYIPEDEDSHLFQLDAKVRELVYRRHAQDPERLRLGLSDISHEYSPAVMEVDTSVKAS